jgi:hypothetical protein
MRKKLIGTRIPESIVMELKDYCNSNGILMNHFVANAIQERLYKFKKKQKRAESEKLIKD